MILRASQKMNDSSSPSLIYTPDEVVRLQLKIYKKEFDGGIEIVLRFASPFNKRSIGLLRRFEYILKSPSCRPELRHRTGQPLLEEPLAAGCNA